MTRKTSALPTQASAAEAIDPGRFNAFIESAKDEQGQRMKIEEIDQSKTFPFKSSKTFHERMVKAARYEGLSLKEFMRTAVLKEVERVENSRR
jgi:predicted HicB family RNase H-like nuclease